MSHQEQTAPEHEVLRTKWAEYGLADRYGRRINRESTAAGMMIEIASEAQRQTQTVEAGLRNGSFETADALIKNLVALELVQARRSVMEEMARLVFMRAQLDEAHSDPVDHFTEIVGWAADSVASDIDDGRFGSGSMLDHLELLDEMADAFYLEPGRHAFYDPLQLI